MIFVVNVVGCGDGCSSDEVFVDCVVVICAFIVLELLLDFIELLFKRCGFLGGGAL